MQAGGLSLIGLFAGALAYFVFPGFDLEENVGLGWLFQQRGVIQAPSEVAVVAIDSKSTSRLSQNDTSKTLPRQFHADLINTLSAAGAKAIVFDVFFKGLKDPAQDQALAEAIKQANNVILVANMHRELVDIGAPGDDGEALIVVDKLLSPAPPFSESAWALSPFVLPKVPARVNQFWSYYESAADTPTLPARALERFNLENLPALGQALSHIEHPDAQALAQTLIDTHPNKNRFMALRRFVQQYPDLADEAQQRLEDNTQLAQKHRQSLLALFNMYQHGGRYYLNFYGPPYSITTHPVHHVIGPQRQTSLDVDGKVVFVGFSERLQPQQRDSYYTIYTADSGADISGVEIAATAFANLLHRNTIEPVAPSVYLSIIVFFSLLIALAAWWLPATLAVVAVIALVTGYVFLCNYFFSAHALWLPLIVPAFIQAPLILFSALVWQYTLTNRERKRIRRAFGYYLPDNVVNDLAPVISSEIFF